MTTVTITQARKNLSSWLRRAEAGEEIGILDGDKIVALRPVDTIETTFEEITVDSATRNTMDAVVSEWKKRK